MTPQSEPVVIDMPCNEIFAALAAAQAKVLYPKRDARGQAGNQQTRYADLAECWQACREALTEQGICVVQMPAADGQDVTVTTILGHKSGQSLSSSLKLRAMRPDPQAIGSAITYARRYGLTAMVGLAPEDDDGHAASTAPAREAKAERPAKPAPKPEAPAAKPAQSEPAASQPSVIEQQLTQSIEIERQKKAHPPFDRERARQNFTYMLDRLGETEYRTYLESYRDAEELIRTGEDETRRIYKRMMARAKEIALEVA